MGTLGVVQARALQDERASATLRRAIERAQKRGSPPPWEPLYWLAVVQSRGGDVEGALKSLRMAVETIERGEGLLRDDKARARYWSDKAGVFKLLVKLLLAKGRIEEALAFHERAKAAEMADVARRAGPGRDQEAQYAVQLEAEEAQLQGMFDAEVRKPKRDEAQVKRLRTTLSDIRKRREAWLEKLGRQADRFDKYALRPEEIGKVREHLPSGVLIVAPVVLDDEVAVIAATSQRFTHHEVVAKAGEVQELVTAFRAEMKVRRLDAEADADGSDAPSASRRKD